MKKKKGFTLIELLAVIVILSIIALIAVPIIMGIINDARKNAFKRSAESVLNSSVTTYQRRLLSDSNNIGAVYECKNNKCISSEKDENGNPLVLDVEGNMGDGEVHVENDGRISFTLTNGSYCAVKYEETSKIFLYDGNCDNIDISNDTTPPTVSVTNRAGSNSIYLSISAEDHESTIKGYSCKIGNGEFSEIKNENVCSFTGLNADTEYTIVVRVYNKLPNNDNYIEANNMAEKTVVVKTSLIATPDINLIPAEDKWMQAKKAVIQYNGENEIISTYSVKREDGTEVVGATNGTEVIIRENNLYVIAENKDSNNNIKTRQQVVDKIDRTKPTNIAVSLEKTTNSIILTVNAVDNESGIYGYMFSKDNGATWVSTEGANKYQTSNVYTFNNLTTGTYSIKVKAINNAYKNTLDNSVLQSEANEDLGTETKDVSVVLDGCSAPTYSFADNKGDVWTQGKTVNIASTSPSGFTIQYTTKNPLTETINESDWITGTSVSFTSNGSVTARVTDGKNVCNGSTLVVDKIDISVPTNVELTTTKTTNSITVTASATDGDSDIYGYMFSKDNGATWVSTEGANKYQTSNVYTFNNLTAGTYNIKVRATNNAWNNSQTAYKDESKASALSTATAVTLDGCSAPTYSFADNKGDVWTQGKTVNIASTSPSGYYIEYTVDDGVTWTRGTSASFTSNGSIIARVTDGTNTCNAATQIVDKIDTTAPTNVSFTTTKTTNSITVTASATDAQSGIYGFEFSKDNGATWSAMQTTGSTSTSEQSKEFTYNGVTSGTYSIRVRATNNAWNNSQSQFKDTTKSVTTTNSEASTLDPCSAPTYSFADNKGNVWTQGKTVNISTTSPNGYYIEYTLDDGLTWTRGTSASFTSNGSVTARVTDGTNTCNAATQIVDKIDTTAPTNVSFTTTKTTNSITVTARATDAQSGIYGFEFSKDNGTTWSAMQTTGSTSTSEQSKVYTGFTSLATGTYNIRVRAINNAWSNSQSEYKDINKAVTTTNATAVSLDGCSAPTYSFTNNNGNIWTQGKTVNIASTSPSGYYIEYTVDDGSTWTTGTSKSFTANGNITARVTDGTNTCNGSTQVVDKIDTTAPTNVSFTTTKTTNSITVTASATDAQSGIYGFEFSKDNGTTWSAMQTTGSTSTSEQSKVYTGFTSLATGTYNIKVRATNNAYNNSTTSFKNNTLGITATTNASSVVLDSCSAPTYSFVDNKGNVWAKSKTVNISTTSPSGYYIEYTVDDGLTWTRGTSKTFTANGNITARVTDGTNTCNGSTQVVDKIDTNSPTVTFTSHSATTDTITINTSMADTGGSGLTTPICLYGTSSGSYTTNCTTKTNSVSTITGLDIGETYYYKICAVDVAGNNDKCITGSVATSQPTASDIYYNNATYTGGNDITVQSALEYLYSKLN